MSLQEEISYSEDIQQEKSIFSSLEYCLSIKKNPNNNFISRCYTFMVFSLQEKYLNTFQRGQGEEESQ